jgi:hypothetical protein
MSKSKGPLETGKDLFRQQFNLAVTGLLSVSCLLGIFGLRALWFWAWYELCYFALWFNVQPDDVTRSDGGRSGPIWQSWHRLLAFLKRSRWSHFKFQAIASWVLLFVGIVYLVVWRSGPLYLLRNRVEISYYQRWEVAALLWNVVFAATSYIKDPLTGKVVPVLRCVAGAGLTSLAFWALINANDRLHLVSVLLIAATYLGIDIRMIFHERLRFLLTVLFADSPTIFALSVLFFFIRKGSARDNMEIYVSGIISFQFIVSSFVLALIDSDIFKVLTSRPKIASAPRERAAGAAVGKP